MKYFFIAIIFLTFLITGLIFFNKKETLPVVNNNSTPSPEIQQNLNITANFKVITGDITRNFSAEKYHNKSPDVYIEANNPSLVHVKKTGIKWSDFFNTLPMKLSKDCLITGDGKSLCDKKDGSLKFYLNDKEDRDLLDREIKEGDKALIKFTF